MIHLATLGGDIHDLGVRKDTPGDCLGLKDHNDFDILSYYVNQNCQYSSGL